MFVRDVDYGILGECQIKAGLWQRQGAGGDFGQTDLVGQVGCGDQGTGMGQNRILDIQPHDPAP